MKTGTILTLTGVTLLGVGIGAAVYTYVTDKNVKKKTDNAIEDLMSAVNNLAEKVKANAEEAAEKAQEMAENNLKWSQKQWEKITR